MQRLTQAQLHRHTNNTAQNQSRSSSNVVPRHVSDAFLDVDIGLLEESRPIEEASRRPVEQQSRQRSSPNTIHHQEDGGDDPPLQSLQSMEEEYQSSLQTMSEAFSDVDAGLLDQEKKTVQQRKKELEYLARSWTRSYDNEGSVNDDDGGGAGMSGFVTNNKTATAKTAATTQERPPTTKTTFWTNSNGPSSQKANKFKKVTGEPTLRLKGNKSLVQKFASLVNAYDD